MPLSDDEIKAELRREVAEAAKILREDGHTVHLTAIRAKLDKQYPDPEPEPEPPDPNAPPPPPKKPEPSPSDTERERKGGWWPKDAFDEA